MKIVVVGMSNQDAAAFSMLVAKVLPGWKTARLSALSELVLTAGQVAVVDLPSLGLHRHSEAHADTVLQAFAGASAILLTTRHDQSWSDWITYASAIDSIYLLQKPYRAIDMQLALERQTAKKVPAPVAEPLLPAKLLVPEEGQLSVKEFQVAVVQRDLSAPSFFLRTVAGALKSGQSFEIRLTMQHCIVVCADERWIATNTPAPVIQRLIHSDGLASVAKVSSIESAAGMRLARRLNMEFQPTDIFLWELLNPTTPKPTSAVLHL
jgi:hypothetical protein